MEVAAEAGDAGGAAAFCRVIHRTVGGTVNVDDPGVGAAAAVVDGTSDGTVADTAVVLPAADGTGRCGGGPTATPAAVDAPATDDGILTRAATSGGSRCPLNAAAAGAALATSPRPCRR